MKNLSLAVLIVLFSSLVNHGASNDGLVIQQTLRQPITQGHYNLNQSFQENTAESINGTAAPIQYITEAPEGFYNTTDAVESPDIRISGRGNSTDHSEDDENVSIGSWVWVVVIIVVILLLIPVILLLVPRFRQRLKFFPSTAPTGVSAHQEMPQTKQDVTEIQWDLAWMEMANLLDKQHYPGS